MKKFLVLIALTVPMIAFAKPIALQPGSSVVIDGDLVSCAGTPASELPPLCTIKQDSGYFRVYSGTTIVNSFYNFDEALEGVKKLKVAGLCR